VTAAHRGELSLVAPTLIQTGYGERPGQAPRTLDLYSPLGTVVGCGQKHALVATFLTKHYGGHETPGTRVSAPFSTVTAKDHHALVTSHLLKYYGTSTGAAMQSPLPTVTSGGWKFAEVRAFLLSYYGTDQAPQLSLPLPTATTRDRFAIVTVRGHDYVIADIGMRMLQPRELFRAQSFPDSYEIAPEYNGKPLTKTSQVRCAGNSVCPVLATALVDANFRGRQRSEMTA
jgi:DNA (cytosine-5)-methyltransferase 1